MTKRFSLFRPRLTLNFEHIWFYVYSTAGYQANFSKGIWWHFAVFEKQAELGCAGDCAADVPIADLC